MISVSIAERFNTPDYEKFRDIVSKSGLDGSLKVRNNKIVFGSSSIKIPYFKSTSDVKEELELKKQKLLLEFNDLYDKIIISEEPIIYRNRYQNVSKSIEQIDLMIDEIDSYISTVNEEKINNPISKILQEIQNNKNNTQYAIEGTKDNVHIPKSVINKVVAYHNTGVKLEHKLKEAKDVNETNYIIWDKPLKDDIYETQEVLVSSKKSSSTKKLTSAKKVVIKKATKKLMVEKLS
jgi:hypothetical protein